MTGKIPNENPGRDGGNTGDRHAVLNDLDDILRQRWKNLRHSPRILGLLAAAVMFFWGISGFYRVQPDQQGVVLLYGEYVKTTQPGLNYWFPAPIGEVIKPRVTQTNQITIGFRGEGATLRDMPQESQILASDQNIADVQFVVQWRIGDAADFLFNVRAPELTIKTAAESALREVIGRTPLQAVLTNQRDLVAGQARDLLQEIMDSYGAGVAILDLRIQKADPPKDVIDAFNDVQRAKQDEERLSNEALAYRNGILPRARGDAARKVQNASAEKEKLIKEAEGEAARFTAFYRTYALDKDLTVLRLYIETMEEVLRKANVVLVSEKGAGVVPYLRLPMPGNRGPSAQEAP